MLGCGLIQLNQSFRQIHDHTFRGKVEFAEIAPGKRHQHLLRPSTDDQQRHWACAPVYILNDANGLRSILSGISAGYVHKSATDEVSDVDFVGGEGDSLCARNGKQEPFQLLRRADGVNAGKVKDDAALVEPVVSQFNRAWLQRAILVDECEVFALGELFRKVGEGFSEDLASSTLRAKNPRKPDPILFLCDGILWHTGTG